MKIGKLNIDDEMEIARLSVVKSYYDSNKHPPGECLQMLISTFCQKHIFCNFFSKSSFDIAPTPVERKRGIGYGIQVYIGKF